MEHMIWVLPGVASGAGIVVGVLICRSWVKDKNKEMNENCDARVKNMRAECTKVLREVRGIASESLAEVQEDCVGLINACIKESKEQTNDARKLIKLMKECLEREKR